MRQRILVTSGGHMNRDDEDGGTICIIIPSYPRKHALFALPVDRVPPHLLDVMKQEGTQFTAIVGIDEDADDENLLGYYGIYLDGEPESVSASDFQSV